MELSLQVVFVTLWTWNPVLCPVFAWTRRRARLTVPFTPVTWKRR